ncbi:MAG: methionine--tRNA ligase [Bacteroidetes bacterium QS_9_68_14]|nr:MAG: methionine--tRNA ligase [Bacteroidetes bacterium QS_9_68_14]
MPDSGDREDRLLVTAALPYANGPIHIGHLAGAYLPADLFCRYQRLKGRDVAFICGSDEMGVPIFLRALREDRDAQDVVDEFHAQIEEHFARFGMSFDHYGRTTSETHRETAQGFFRALAEKDALTLRTAEQLYDPEAELFLADRFVRGTCPVCGYDDAYGDQCEDCGSDLSPDELIAPRSVLTDAEPVEKEATHFYLPLDRLQADLEAWLDDAASDWKPNVRGQVQSWLGEGLRERAITRDLPWGVPVPPGVAEEAGMDPEGKVLYVWFDAPVGYISATKEWGAQQGDPERWKDYWQRDDSRLIHFIGKDNIVFHCVMFPAMLQARGGYVLPENVPANEFLTIEGRKLSTSRGWAVWLHEFLDDFADRDHPADLLRYALASTLPETKDADFSWEGFQNRVNGELADVLGNFVHRALTFCQDYFDGLVPPLRAPSEEDRAALDALAEATAEVGRAYEGYRMRAAAQETMALARRGNKYFNDTAPWHTRESDPQACANTVHVSLQFCASLSVLAEPVLPGAAAKLRDMLRLDGRVRPSTPEGDAGDNDDRIGWDDAAAPILDAGHAIGTPEILFAKVEDQTIQQQMSKLGASNAASDAAPAESPPAKTPAEAGYAPLKDEIAFDDFMDMDLRTGRVTEAAPVEGADKLIRLQVDLGFEQRQVLAGVAEQYSPSEMEGRRVVLVANLAPKEMFGHESQGMVLMAEDREGRLTLVSGEGEPGAVVR